jgi:hypothetical protein
MSLISFTVPLMSISSFNFQMATVALNRIFDDRRRTRCAAPPLLALRPGASPATTFPMLVRMFDLQPPRNRLEQALGPGMGDRPQAAGGRGAADHLLRPLRHLPAALRQGTDDNDQQHLQWLTLRRHQPRSVAPGQALGPLCSETAPDVRMWHSRARSCVGRGSAYLRSAEACAHVPASPPKALASVSVGTALPN